MDVEGERYESARRDDEVITEKGARALEHAAGGASALAQQQPRVGERRRTQRANSVMQALPMNATAASLPHSVAG